MNQRQKASQFRDMHKGPGILTLPNAWDVITARIFESAGFPAIGTTSAGIAATLGYVDGQKIGCDEMLRAVRRIVSSVRIPVTADIEAGYGATPGEVVENVERFIESGIAGINIEDSINGSRGAQEPACRQAEKIAAIRVLADQVDIPLVINARIDSMHRGGRDKEALLEETFHRAELYLKAGADCIFVFGEQDKSTISRIVQAVDGPVNILVGALTPSIRELKELGVARVSIGPGAMKATLSLVKQIADELMTEGTYESFIHVPMSYQEMFGYLHTT